MPKGDKYAKLGEYLKKSNENLIKLSYETIEGIIGDKLPNSAYSYAESWWSNHYGHSQAVSWMDVGYKTDYVSDTYQQKAIIFIRNQNL